MIKSILQSSVFPCARTKVSPVKVFTKLSSINLTSIRSIHITSINGKEYRTGNSKIRATDTKKHVRLDGEDSVEIQTADQQESEFPDAFTPDTLFNGIPYKDLHIINIKSTPNNTIMTTTDAKGDVTLIHSAGIEGFKHAKKGTNIAAQQAALTMGTRTLENGIKTVRIRVQGIGAGRMAAIKGLQLAGLKIVSITDDTRVSWNPPRPRKQRRI
ncbi:mitochondrial ribosomal protein S11 [Calliopsis andreniformis]|uniref:mitochondrial ribosomal protein S11 n=1 Tax=Calliopsis andreniformis TaxID=337506 RepID=UPI003FCD9ABB